MSTELRPTGGDHVSADGGADQSAQPRVDYLDHHDMSVPGEVVRHAYTEMRERCPVAHIDLYGGYELISRHEDVQAVVDDHETFSSAGEGVLIPPSGLGQIQALEDDRPEHTASRKVFNAAVSPQAVRELRPAITEVVNAQIDKFARLGSADLIADLADPVPALVIGRMAGFDADGSIEIHELAVRTFAAIGTEEFPDAFSQFSGFVEAALDNGRRNPGTDFLSQLASGSVAGVPTDNEYACRLLVSLFIGGHHSTASGLAGLFYHVLTDRSLRNRLVEDPTLIAPAIEESLRLTTPLQLFARTALRDTKLADKTLAAGARVFVNYAAANRDPRVFEAPDEFRIDRKPNQHLAFGHGVHNCVGKQLARAEMDFGLTEVLRRLPDVELVETNIPESGLIGGTLMTRTHLPVRFTPESA